MTYKAIDGVETSAHIIDINKHGHMPMWLKIGLNHNLNPNFLFILIHRTDIIALNIP